ncbi:MAG TPA: hypothetical protein VEY30_05300, partial [Myxococcaceae bacterium]|nr:hypothetical protein [Myxococcaceae bacterium]
MIRFRLGQGWKREEAPSPVDSLRLSVDGVDLLAGASEERLWQVVPEWVASVMRLWGEGQRFVQVSLPEAHLEVVLERRGSDALLSVLSLARPARRTRAAVTLELEELRDAAVRCARELHQDLCEWAPALAGGNGVKRMLKRAEALERTPLSAPRTPTFDTGYGFRTFVRDGGVGFELDLQDPEDLLGSYRGKDPGALPSLLCDGALGLRLGADEPWRSPGLPYLFALELSRQAGDLGQALEHGEGSFTFSPGGLGPEMTVDLRRGTADSGGGSAAVAPEALLRNLYGIGLSFVLAATRRNPKQRQNPYLVELQARCQEGWVRWKEVSPPGADAQAAEAPAPPQSSVSR